MRRFALLAALIALFAVGSPGTAGAVDVAVSAQVLSGSRTMTATLTPFVAALRGQAVDSALAVTVTEAAVNGVTPWSVTTRLCGRDAGGTAPDCTAEPDLIKLDATNRIAGSSLTISGRSVTPVLGGGTSTATSGSENLSTTRTLFTNTGQDPSLVYTGTYESTATVTLTPPVSAIAGTYTGYLVVTLVS